MFANHFWSQTTKKWLTSVSSWQSFCKIIFAICMFWQCTSAMHAVLSSSGVSCSLQHVAYTRDSCSQLLPEMSDTAWTSLNNERMKSMSPTASLASDLCLLYDMPIIDPCSQSVCTMSPGPRPTSVPSGILIHPALWPQQTWTENWGEPRWGQLCPGDEAYLHAKFHLDLFNRLAIIHQHYRQDRTDNGPIA